MSSLNIAHQRWSSDQNCTLPDPVPGFMTSRLPTWPERTKDRHRHMEDWQVSSNGTRISVSGPFCEFLLSRTPKKLRSRRTEGESSSEGMSDRCSLPQDAHSPASSLPHHKYRRWASPWAAQPSGEEDAQTWQAWMHRQDVPRCTNNTWPNALDIRHRRSVSRRAGALAVCFQGKAKRQEFSVLSVTLSHPHPLMAFWLEGSEDQESICL